MVAMYTVGQFSTKLKETIRTALDLNWEKFKAVGPAVMIDVEKYAAESCEEACKRHGTTEFLPLIIAAVSGNSSRCMDWVNEPPVVNLPSNPGGGDCPACGMG